MKKHLLYIISCILCINTTITLALGDYDTQDNSQDCIVLKNNLRLRSSDTNTQGEVTKLQQFLIDEGYLTLSKPTGYFGSGTRNAVMKYQKDIGLDSTGYVGSLTRSKIKDNTCNSDNVSDNNTTSTNNNSNISATLSFYGTNTISLMSATISNAGDNLKYCIYVTDTTKCDTKSLLLDSGLNWSYSPNQGGTYTIQQDVTDKKFPAVPYTVRLFKQDGTEKSVSLIRVGGVITNDTTIINQYNNTTTNTPPIFTSNVTGDNNKITNMNITIKQGGPDLKYCIYVVNTTPCTSASPLLSSGLNFQYSTNDGGTYTLNQDVSSKGFPPVNYTIILEKANGVRGSYGMSVGSNSSTYKDTRQPFYTPANSSSFYYDGLLTQKYIYDYQPDGKGAGRPAPMSVSYSEYPVSSQSLTENNKYIYQFLVI